MMHRDISQPGGFSVTHLGYYVDSYLFTFLHKFPTCFCTDLLNYIAFSLFKVLPNTFQKQTKQKKTSNETNKKNKTTNNNKTNQKKKKTQHDILHKGEKNIERYIKSCYSSEMRESSTDAQYEAFWKGCPFNALYLLTLSMSLARSVNVQP